MTGRRYYRSVAYRKAIAFVALNDDPADLDLASVAGLVTVALVSEVWSIPAAVVAADVVQYRAGVAVA